MKIGSLSCLIGSIGACAAVAGLSPAPALAVTNKPGVGIFASGPADQSVLLNGTGRRNGFGSDWTGLLTIWTANPATDQRYVVSTTFQLTGDPSVTYTPTSTYAALDEFGSSPGKQDLSQDPAAEAESPPVLDGFISTDEAPPNSQRAWAQIGSNDETPVPVAQTPVALIFSLPAGITLGGGNTLSLINNGPGDAVSTVQAIFDGKVGPSRGYPANTWGALLTRAGLSPITSGPQYFGQFLDLGSASAHTGGYQPLELEVRSGDAPETDALQTFLAMSGDQNMTSASDAERNWPSDANDGAGSNGYPAGPFGANVDGAAEVKNTLATPGTIGYVVVGDAVYAVPNEPFYPSAEATTYNGTASHEFLFAAVQSDEGSGAANRQYANPGQVQHNSSGSFEVVPNLYTGGTASVTGDCQLPYSLTQVGRVGSLCQTDDQDGPVWEGSLSDPDVYQHAATPGRFGTDAYPIVETAYNSAWATYDALGNLYGSPANATETGNTVRSYLEWATKPTGGQAAIHSSKVGWDELPSSVVAAAHAAAGGIDGPG